MELKKGMKVQLKFLSKIDGTRLSVMPAMEKFFGRGVTLATDPNHNGDFWIVEDKYRWWFSSDWVAKIYNNAVEETTWDKDMLKNGARVRLKSRDHCYNICNGPAIVEGMDRWFGKTVIVEEYPAYGSGVLFRIKGSPYNYHTDWIKNILPKAEHKDLRLIRLRIS